MTAEKTKTRHRVAFMEFLIERGKGDIPLPQELLIEIGEYAASQSKELSECKEKTGPHIQNRLLCGYCNGDQLDAGQEYCKPCRATGLITQKVLRVADLREVEGLLNKEEITYSRMVEILNERATKFMYEWIKEAVISSESQKDKEIEELKETANFKLDLVKELSELREENRKLKEDFADLTISMGISQ